MGRLGPRSFARQLLATRWNVGFLDASDLDAITVGKGPPVRWLQHDFKDRWFADPFILNADSSKIDLLVEEWVDDLRRGRISKLVVDRSTVSIERVIPLLDTGSHLSFPNIFSRSGRIFVQPESCAAGRSSIYQYNSQQETLELIGSALDEPLTDAVIFPEPIGGRFYMFSTKLPDPSGSALDVYSSDRWDTGYAMHSTMRFTEKIARNAGGFFKLGPHWIRPAQNCDLRYGHGLVFQKLIFDGGRFSLSHLGSRYPDSSRWNLGIHTFNVQGPLAVVDGYAWRTPYLGAILSCVGVRQGVTKLASTYFPQ